MRATILVILLGTTTLVAGCSIWPATRSEEAGPEGSLRDYAESVFREQNRLLSRLAMAMADAEGRGTETYNRLAQAESRMLKACAPLNQVASMRSRGEESGLLQDIRASRSLERCDAATDRVARLLGNMSEPSTSASTVPGDTGAQQAGAN